MEINSQSISILGDVLVVIAVLALLAFVRSDRQSSGKIVEMLDRISTTQMQISTTQLQIFDTQSKVSATQLQIIDTQKDQSRIQQDMLTRLAVMDAKGYGANPNG